jgi:hypothetical protein
LLKTLLNSIIYRIDPVQRVNAIIFIFGVVEIDVLAELNSFFLVTVQLDFTVAGGSLVEDFYTVQRVVDWVLVITKSFVKGQLSFISITFHSIILKPVLHTAVILRK